MENPVEKIEEEPKKTSSKEPEEKIIELFESKEPPKTIKETVIQSNILSRKTLLSPTIIGKVSAGAGVIPGLTFTELATGAGDAHNPSGTGSWEDWDISSLIPAEAVLVEVLMENVSGTQALGARKDGSSLNRAVSLLAYGPLTMMVNVDSDRIIEIYAQTSAGDAYFWIAGYYT